jgi:hypothetical protein
MWPYWIMFIFPAIAAMQDRPIVAKNRDGSQRVYLNGGWVICLIVLVLLIGFRFEVGGDWFNYFYRLNLVKNQPLEELVKFGDPGFMVLNALSVSLGWGMTGVNSMSAVLFASGLIIFVRSLPRPWLALACAIPYLVIVVGMGYTRQSIALGFVMVGLVSMRRGRFIRFAIWVALGALFHKTAVLIFPIAALTSEGQRFKAIGLVGLIGAFAFDTLLADYTDHLVDVYVNNQRTESQGAFVRLSMNVIPAILFLFFGKHFLVARQEYKLWKVISWVAVAMFLAFLGTGYSTALDRMALYIIPLQLMVFSNLPDVFGRTRGRSSAILAGILLYYFSILVVWLNFANNSRYWIPFQLGFS